MTTVYDIPADKFINELAKKLEKDENISTPDANLYSRTSVSRENPPVQKNWWYIRCASILRKLYTNNLVGTEKLKAMYGGRHNRGSKKHKARSGSGTIIRRALQQLEKSGYVIKVKGKGRSLSSKGRSFLDNLSNDILKDIKDDYPELEKY